MRTALVGVVAAVVAGAGAWFVTGQAVDGPPELPPSDRVQQPAAAFDRGEHVWVAPDTRDVVSEADEARLEEEAATSDPPVYVVVAHRSYDDGSDGPIPTAEALWWHGDDDAVYVLWEAPGQGYVETGERRLEDYLSPDFDGDPVRRISEAIAAVDATTFAAPYDDEPAAWEKVLIGGVLGLIAWLVVGLPLALVVRHRRRNA